MLLVFADLADEETGVQNEAGCDCAKKKHAEKDFDVVLPIEDDPAEANRNGGSGEQHSQGQKEGDFCAPADAHSRIVARRKAFTAEIAEYAEKTTTART